MPAAAVSSKEEGALGGEGTGCREQSRVYNARSTDASRETNMLRDDLARHLDQLLDASRVKD
jgi:hypothetical protein